jgi:hypothetical protein
MESIVVALLNKIPDFILYLIPIVWLTPKVFGMRVVRRTHGGVKFTTKVLFHEIFNYKKWSLSAPYIPHEQATVITIHSGICIYCKFFTDIEIYPTARQTTSLQYQALMTKNGRTIAVSTIIAYEVVDLLKAFGETWDIEDIIKDISLAKVRLLLTSMTFEDISKEQISLDEKLSLAIRLELENYGINVIKAYFTDLAPSGNTFFMNSENSVLIPATENK